MRDPKLPEHEPGADGDDLDDFLTQDQDAWRGDVHIEDQSWRREAPDESWRGEAHFADWPEHAAGPEYWMFKAKAEGA